ncbi:MAG: ABC transporter permease [Thermoplasmata archaeon]|nr:ABC transporter permease [Thermoplasmata archaeon]
MTNLLKQIYYVAWGDMKFLRHNILNIVVMSIMSPILYLIAFGFGLRTGTTDIGVSYVSFVIPGIVALSSLNSSFSSTSARMNVQRLYYKSFDEMMMCPLSLHAIVWGKCMLGLIRGLFGCFLLYALGLALGYAGVTEGALQLTPMLVICTVLSCIVFSFLGMAAALIAKSHQSMATFNSLVILPMTFLCGTFFSVSALNPVFQAILYCFPLTYSSEIIRAAALPDYLDFPWLCLLVLILWGAAFYALDYWLLKTRKV